jgi:hypothetical protein
MGAFEETSSNGSQFGFRIYKLIKDSPLEKAGVKEMTDFIIPPDEVLNQKNTFNDWILSLADKTIKMKIYSLLNRNFKEVEIKANPTGTKDGILGAGVKYEDYENADKRLLHVTSVIENSFAQSKLGLVPNDDYIIAVKTKSSPIISLNKDEFNPLEILNMVISNNKGNDLIFYIYNKIKGPRTVEVNINKDDDFVLGCDVAYGALHEFPKVQEEIAEEIIINKENKNNEINKDEKLDNIEQKEQINEIKETVELKQEENNDIKKEEDNNVIEEDII